MKVLSLFLFFLPWFHAQAQTLSPDGADALPARIAAARDDLEQQRQAIEAQYEARQRECWQRFAVNDCLREARRSRYAALDPLRPLSLELNAQERDWRTRQRDERLRHKQDTLRQP